jgi:hypothetical protein
VLGKHTMKFGGAFHSDQVNGNPIAQFNGPGSVDGDIGSSTFGRAISTAAPRIMQGAVKLNF